MDKRPAELIAARPELLQTGARDFRSDPKGEFLAVTAVPVLKPPGKQRLDTYKIHTPGGRFCIRSGITNMPAVTGRLPWITKCSDNSWRRH